MDLVRKLRRWFGGVKARVYAVWLMLSVVFWGADARADDLTNMTQQLGGMFSSLFTMIIPIMFLVVVIGIYTGLFEKIFGVFGKLRFS